MPAPLLVPIVVHVVRTVVICAGKQIIKHAVKKGVKQAVRKNTLKISKNLKDFAKNSSNKNCIQTKQNNITGAEKLNKDEMNSIFDVAKKTENKGFKLLHDANQQVQKHRIMPKPNPLPKSNNLKI